MFWNQIRSEEFEQQAEVLRQHQLNNLGNFYKIFPVEDTSVERTGGLFNKRTVKTAKAYYSKFDHQANGYNLMR